MKRTRQPTFRWLVVPLLLGLARLSPAATIELSLTDLSDAIAQSASEPDALRRLLLEDIEQQLVQADLLLADGELVFHDRIENLTLDGGCNSTTLRHLDTDVTLSGDTRLALRLDSLHEPIVIDLTVAARIDASGRVRQSFGIRAFGCNRLGRDTFDVSATGPLSLAVQAKLTLNPVRVAQRQLQLRPAISLDGELITSDIRVDVDDTITRRVIEKLLQRRVDEAFGPARIEQELTRLQQSLSEQLGAENGVIDLALPDPTDTQVMALLELFAPGADFSLTTDYLMRHRDELLAAVLLGDSARITALISDATACTAATALQVPLATPALYSLASGSCARADLTASDQLLFGDAGCTEPVDFTPTSFADFCQVVTDPVRLGNAATAASRWSAGACHPAHASISAPCRLTG